MRYHLHQDLIDPARPKSELWRLVAGLIAGFAVYFYALMLYQDVVAGYLSIPRWVVEIGLTNGTSPAWMLILLFSFATLIVAVGIVTAVLHHRSMLTLFGPRDRCITGFGRVFVAVLLLYGLLSVLPPYDDYELLKNDQMPFGKWAVLLPVSLAALGVQVISEEILFRGYMQSQLAAWRDHPLIWMGIPSVLFAALHYSPSQYGDAAGLVVLWAVVFGLAAADLTARSGTLGPAIALHMVNNATSFLLVAYPDFMGGLALYHMPFTLASAPVGSMEIVLEICVIGLSWLAARIALRR